MFMDLQAQQLTDALIGGAQLNKPTHAHSHHHSHDYDPFKCPPDLHVAQLHGEAKRVYANAPMRRLSILEKEICPCCGLPEKGNLIPLRAPLSELYHLGSGYALYFQLLRYCIYLLTIMFVLTGFFHIISSAAASDCLKIDDNDDDSTHGECVQDFILMFTIANKKNDASLLVGQMALNLITVIVMGVFFQYMRYQLRKIHIEADDLTVTPSDYTVKITGLNPELTDEEIKEWIEGLNTEENPVQVVKIHRTYDVALYVELRQKREMLESMRVTLQFEKKDNVHEVHEEVKQTLTELEKLKSDGLKATDTVLITFDKAHQAAYVCEEYSKVRFDNWTDYITAWFGTTSENFRGKDCFIERAPEPTDIRWENLAFGSWERWKKRSYTKVFTLLIIIASFGIIILINWGQGEALKKFGPKSHVVQAFSGLGSVLVVAINTILSIAVTILTEREKHPTYTSYFTAVAEKLCIAQFLNTALTTTCAQVLLYNTFSSTGSFKEGLLSVPFYAKGGLVENMFYVFITNAFLTPALSYFDPMYYFKLYKRRKAIKKGENTHMTQKQANELFEEPEMDLAVKNALLVKTMLMTAFFAPAVPFAIIFAIMGLVCDYWIDKYLLLRRNVLPIAMQNELCVNMIENIEWMGLMFGLGNLLFICGLQNSGGTDVYEILPKGLMYTILGIGFVLAMIPSEAINDKVFPIVDEVTEFSTYESVRVEFSTDYAVQNPVTSDEAIKEQAGIFKQKKEAKKVAEKTLKNGLSRLVSLKKANKVIKEGEDNKPLLEKKKLNLKGLLGLGRDNTSEETAATINDNNSPDQL